MLKGKLICNNNSQCYFATARHINDLSDSVGLDVISVSYVNEDGVDEMTNMIVSKDNQKLSLFASDNPLRIIDFLVGYAKGKSN